jgi:hypothetical protein
MATDHEGLFVIDPKSKEVKQFVNNKFDTTSLSENTAKHLMLDKNGSMWISTYRNGVNQYIEKMVGFKTLELGIPIGASYAMGPVQLDLRYNIGLTYMRKHGEYFPDKNRVLQLTVGYRFEL